jgi:hypothetical protein
MPEKEIIHQKHALDGFPLCWNMVMIENWRVRVKTTKDENLVTCHHCIRFRNEGLDLDEPIYLA